MHNQTSPWARGGTLRTVALFAAVAVLAVVLATILRVKADALVGAGLAFAGVIMDSTNEFADAVAINTGAPAIFTLGSNIDLSKTGRDLGNGRPLFLVISIDTAVTSAGAATVQFQLVSDAQDPIAADGSASLHWQSAAIPKATLVAGYQIVVPLPLRLPDYERFLGVNTVIGTAALTAGKANAFLTADPPSWKAYPNSPNAI